MNDRQEAEAPQFVIESDVPIQSRTKQCKYPFAKLEVGDSFFVPGIKMSVLSSAASGARKRTGFKFTTRTVDGGVRTWRTE
jgi:hypothetical protein